MIIVILDKEIVTGKIIDGMFKGENVYDYFFVKVNDYYTPLFPFLLPGHIIKVSAGDKLLYVKFNTGKYLVEVGELTGKKVYTHRVLERIDYGDVINVIRSADIGSDFINFYYLYHITKNNNTLERFYPDKWRYWKRVIKFFNPERHKIINYKIVDPDFGEMFML